MRWELAYVSDLEPGDIVLPDGRRFRGSADTEPGAVDLGSVVVAVRRGDPVLSPGARWLVTQLAVPETERLWRIATSGPLRGSRIDRRGLRVVV